MRPLLLLLSLLICGCISPSKGKPVPGAGAEAHELQPGDVAFWTHDPEEFGAGVIAEVKGSDAWFHSKGSTQGSFAVPLAQVLPVSRLSPPQWFQNHGDRSCPKWMTAVEIRRTSIVGECRGAPREFALLDVTLPTSQGLFWAAFGAPIFGGLTALCLVTLIVASLARRWASRAIRLATFHSARDHDDDDTPPKAQDAHPKLEALSCSKCRAPTPLAEAETLPCRSCGAAVRMPPEYLEVVRARRFVAERTRAEMRALLVARVLSNPAFALFYVAAGYGVWKAALLLLRNPSTGVLVGMPAFFLPIAFVVGAIGHVFGGVRLRAVSAELEGVPNETGGFDCRVCGAPLQAMRGGVGEACAYCGAQNISPASLAVAAKRASRRRAALRVSIADASKLPWATIARALFWPALLFGVIGLILYPIGIVAGLGR